MSKELSHPDFSYAPDPKIFSYLRNRLKQSPYAGGNKMAPMWMRPDDSALADALVKRGGVKKKGRKVTRSGGLGIGGILIGGCCPMCKKKMGGMAMGSRKKPKKGLLGSKKGGVSYTKMVSMIAKKLMAKRKQKKGGVYMKDMKNKQMRKTQMRPMAVKKRGGARKPNTHAMKVKKIMMEYKRQGQKISLGQASKMASAM